MLIRKKNKKVDIANSDLNNILFCRANNIFDAALVLLAFYLINVLVACFLRPKSFHTSKWSRVYLLLIEPND